MQPTDESSPDERSTFLQDARSAASSHSPAYLWVFLAACPTAIAVGWYRWSFVAFVVALAAAYLSFGVIYKAIRAFFPEWPELTWTGLIFEAISVFISWAR